MSKKHKFESVITGRDPESLLLRAVERYVMSKGGSVLVIGGIQVQTWPDGNSANFTIGVRCTGRKPIPPSRERKGAKND